MSRILPEWRGATDNTLAPMRVKVRIFERYGGLCAECRRKCGIGGERFEFDHIVAVVNGGPNSESNLRLVCVECHTKKTKGDIAEKAMVYRKRVKAIGLRSASRMPGSRNSPWKKRLDGRVVRR